jgi:hypothetical protein
MTNRGMPIADRLLNEGSLSQETRTFYSIFHKSSDLPLLQPAGSLHTHNLFLQDPFSRYSSASVCMHVCIPTWWKVLNANNTLNSVVVVRMRTIPTERSDCCLSVKLLLTFAGRGCCVVSAADSHGR